MVTYQVNLCNEGVGIEVSVLVRQTVDQIAVVQSNPRGIPFHGILACQSENRILFSALIHHSVEDEIYRGVDTDHGWIEQLA
ncbi:hypothetical protein SDC9_113225 [bioreactor metagenome]|uniref:Uncharacterized protein n=1 Tax=bioreactor metagenome TaxID=1076179 RepID=A0A645BMG1_9ZZZZ